MRRAISNSSRNRSKNRRRSSSSSTGALTRPLSLHLFFTLGLATILTVPSTVSGNHAASSVPAQDLPLGQSEKAAFQTKRRQLQSSEGPDETPTIRLLRWRSMVRELQTTSALQGPAQGRGGGLTLAANTGRIGVEVQEGTAETRQFHGAGRKNLKALLALKAFPGLNIKDKWVQKYADAVETYLSPWKAIEGATMGPGRGRGLISPLIFGRITNLPSFMSCCGHVKIVKGKIYFRYGGFLRTWYGTRRFILSLKTIQMAIEEYQLHHLTAEFLLNTCDQPISYDSGTAGLRGGYPIFSTEWVPGSVDILYPDALDLSKSYMSKSGETSEWKSRKSIAVFRGATTNYDIFPDTNWRASPRVRIHAMSDVRPDLLDARISRWSHLDRQVVHGIEGDGILRGKSLQRHELDAFKYEVVVDGGGGSSRTCGVLSSERVMIRQDSHYMQFFQPLLHPFVHYIPTKHFFEDLYSRVEWARNHDDEAQAILQKAHEVAETACTWEGRALYWAVLLVKYSTEAMEDNTAVVEPTDLCSSPFDGNLAMAWKNGVDKDALLPKDWPPLCKDMETAKQPPCTVFCRGGKLDKFRQPWVTMDSLEHIPLA